MTLSVTLCVSLCVNATVRLLPTGVPAPAEMHSPSLCVSLCVSALYSPSLCVSLCLFVSLCVSLYVSVLHVFSSEQVVGLLVAATLAAAMSSIDSVATAGASLFCLDIYRPFIKPDATEQQLVHVGRIVIGVMAILTIIWLPIITVLSDQVFVYIQSVQAYLSPPIFVAYFAGILWPRANERGAMSCLG